MITICTTVRYLMSKTILEIENLEKSFGNKKILKNINLKIEEKSIFGILGRNGTGKTVLMNHLISLIKPDKGCIRFMGCDIEKNLCSYKEKINFASGYQSLQVQSSLMENLKTFAGLYEIKNIDDEIDRVLNLLEIDKNKFGNKKLFNFSSGETSKIVLAKALLNQPKLLFLDEPMAFLDPIYKEKLMKIIKKINREDKTTVIFTSHQLDEVENICSDVAILKEGTVSFVGKKVSKEKLIKYY